MGDEFTGRSSLDNQIREAKTRAELFSKSLQDARAQEAIALKILEQERERWAHSFEEKSIMIEQLERELTSTVEALDVERSTDKLPRAADLKEFSNSEVDQSFHDLMADVNAHIPTLNKSFEFPTMRRTVDMEPHGTNIGSLRSTFNPNTAYAPQHTLPTPATSTARTASKASTAHQPKRAVSPPKGSTRADDTAVWRDLLEQYQDQLRLSKAECVAAADDKEKLRCQVDKLEQEITKLKAEKELFAAACEHAEGKLKFRVAQIIECEESKEALAKRVTELSALNADLHNQLTSLRHELAVANTELRIHSTRSQNQALREHTNVATGIAEASPTQPTEVPQPSVASPQLHPREPVYSSTAFLSTSRDGDLEFPYPARQRIQATEAYAKDLHRQLDEAHANYTAQLDDAKRTASSLQMLLKDSERRGDDLRTRCQAAELAANQYQTERNALLTMVSKLHLSETTKAAAGVQAIADSDEPHLALQERTNHQHHNRQVEPQMPPNASYVPTTATTATAVSSPPSIHPFQRSSPPGNYQQSPAVDQQLARSRDSVEAQDTRTSQLSTRLSPAQVTAEQHRAPLVQLDDSFTDSSSDGEGDCEGEAAGLDDRGAPRYHFGEEPAPTVTRSATGTTAATTGTATQSVLFTSDGALPTSSLESAESPPARSAHASMLRMLSSSSEVSKVQKKATKRRPRTASADGKSSSKKAASVPAVVLAEKRNVSPAPAVGQPGKSMVIRKPASYTGASNDKFPRGRVVEEVPAAASVRTPSGSSAIKGKAASAKKATPPSTQPKAEKKATNTRLKQSIKVHGPSSDSNANTNDVSWGSEDLAPQSRAQSPENGEVYPTTHSELAVGLGPAGHHVVANYGVAVKAPLLHPCINEVSHSEVENEMVHRGVAQDDGDLLNRTIEIVELPDSTVEGGVSYYEVNREANRVRSHSVNSVGSGASSRTGRSTLEAHKDPGLTRGAYSGVTEVKISRKSPGAESHLHHRVGRSPQVPAAESTVRRNSAGKKSRPTATRTPSPMLRTVSTTTPTTTPSMTTGTTMAAASKIAASRAGPVTATSSGSKYYTPASYSLTSSGIAAAVVTPTPNSRSGGGTGKVAKLLSAYGQSSGPMKTTSASKAKTISVRSNSLMY